MCIPKISKDTSASPLGVQQAPHSNEAGRTAPSDSSRACGTPLAVTGVGSGEPRATLVQRHEAALEKRAGKSGLFVRRSGNEAPRPEVRVIKVGERTMEAMQTLALTIAKDAVHGSAYHGDVPPVSPESTEAFAARARREAARLHDSIVADLEARGIQPTDDLIANELSRVRANVDAQRQWMSQDVQLELMSSHVPIQSTAAATGPAGAPAKSLLQAGFEKYVRHDGEQVWRHFVDKERVPPREEVALRPKAMEFAGRIFARASQHPQSFRDAYGAESQNAMFKNIYEDALRIALETSRAPTT